MDCVLADSEINLKTMKDPQTTKMANKELGPLIKYVAKHRGTITELVKLLSKRTGKKWRRENAERWLHKDPKVRTQPLFGVGLLLVEIGKEYIVEVEKAAREELAASRQ